MNSCYIIYPHNLKNFYILKHLEKRGFIIRGIRIYDDDYLIKNNSKIFTYFTQKFCTDKDLEKINFRKKITLYGSRNRKKILYFEKFDYIHVKDLKLKQGDRLLCFEEKFIFEAAILDKNYILPSRAFLYSCKHLYYKRLEIPFYKIRSLEDIKIIPEGKYIFKPSVESVGKHNVFKLNCKRDIYSIIENNKDLLSYNKIFILQPYIEYVSEIWTMVLFDSKQDPYILWYSTEKGHATFSPFDEDLLRHIKNINSKLKIKSWMAYMQFLLDEYGNLHFVDLNPRLPGDDDWHEILYRYMSGKSFAKAIVDLIIDDIKPSIVKTNRYIVEDEYNPAIGLKKNQKLWMYSDNYKQKPLLTFKKA